MLVLCKDTTNFHLNTMSKGLEYISPGTGNYNCSSQENVDDSVLFKDMPSISEHLADAPVREAFYRAIAKKTPPDKFGGILRWTSLQCAKV